MREAVGYKRNGGVSMADDTLAKGKIIMPSKSVTVPLWRVVLYRKYSALCKF